MIGPYSRMRGFGRSKRESLTFLYKLDGYATERGFRDGRAKVGWVSNFGIVSRYPLSKADGRLGRLEHLKEKFK